MAFQFGIDHLLNQPALVKRLKSARVGLIAHPASITGDNKHTLDALIEAGCNITKLSARNTECAETSKTIWSSPLTTSIRFTEFP